MLAQLEGKDCFTPSAVLGVLRISFDNHVVLYLLAEDVVRAVLGLFVEWFFIVDTRSLASITFFFAEYNLCTTDCSEHCILSPESRAS